MSANRATTTTRTAMSLEDRVQAAVIRLHEGRRQLSDVEFLASEDISSYLYEKYEIAQLCRKIRDTVHEDNMMFDMAVRKLQDRINEAMGLPCENSIRPQRRAPIEREHDAMYDAEESWNRDARMAEESRIRDEKMAEEHRIRDEKMAEESRNRNARMDEESRNRNAERRRRLLERMTREKEEGEKAAAERMAKTIAEKPHKPQDQESHVDRNAKPERMKREKELREELMKRKGPIPENKVVTKKPTIVVITLD